MFETAPENSLVFCAKRALLRWFKKVALTPQIFVRDANGSDIAYVKKKLFKLREQIEVFTSRAKDHLLYRIQANNVLDFSAGCLFSNTVGRALGAVRRKGGRENGWVKVLDSMLSVMMMLLLERNRG